MIKSVNFIHTIANLYICIHSAYSPKTILDVAILRTRLCTSYETRIIITHFINSSSYSLLPVSMRIPTSSYIQTHMNYISTSIHVPNSLFTNFSLSPLKSLSASTTLTFTNPYSLSPVDHADSYIDLNPSIS